MPDFEWEDKCRGIVCGIDEAGRGPWAGRNAQTVPQNDNRLW